MVTCARLYDMAGYSCKRTARTPPMLVLRPAAVLRASGQAQLLVSVPKVCEVKAMRS